MSRTDLSLPQARGLGETTRRDNWWAQPLVVFLGFAAFIVYSTWAAFQGNHYWFRGSASQIAESGGFESQYLSPMYSPILFVRPEVAGAAPMEHAWIGEFPDWWPLLIASPALLILAIPALFRFTCYYYRGAYYKAFWADPLNCGVGEPGFRGESYRGERWFPLVLQNVHRYFLYLVLIFIVILSYDAVISYIFVQRDAAGEVVDRTFGIGLGSLVLTLNVILLGGYTFGCHSLRHLVGGKNDCVSANPARYQAWRCVSCFTRRHMIWAWFSLVWVGFTDAYVRLCSNGTWTDVWWVF